MFLRESTSEYNDIKEKSGHRINSWSNQGKYLPNNCRKLQIFLFTMQLFRYYSKFWYVFVFTEKSYLDTMILSKKVVIEPTAEVNEAKSCPKTAKNCKYYYLPIQLFKYYSIFQHIFVFFCIFIHWSMIYWSNFETS